MTTIKIEATHITPYVICDVETGTISIKGRAIPEDSTLFFQPIYEWVDAYIQLKRPLQINLQFEYFNTSVLKGILILLKSLEKTETSINWYYESDDEDMLEEGKDLNDALNLSINFIEIPSR
ncbi:MAG: DUF1987 domain-containing protein [Bacteroidales bacterium]|jgi:hypothetical protein|nr:DUF1987 domain-containing protein [Bacteroidales bacterium]